MNDTLAIGERAQQVLKLLVERYVHEGRPVASRALARDVGLELSPATLRNVMADLEELGFIRAPHTSAGRVPTPRGYRFFVDTLLTVQPLAGPETERLRDELGVEQAQGPDEVLARATQLLSGLSRMASVVTLPRRTTIAFRHVEFLPLSQGRVLAVLVTNEREVHNRVLYPAGRYTAAELEAAANYLNAHFQGQGMERVRQRIVGDLRETHASLDRLMRTVLDMGERLLADEPERGGCVIAGQTNLMGFSELSDVQRLRQLFEAFQEKQRMLALLEQCLHAEGVQIFIGRESGYEALDECSVVTAPYTVDGETVGVLGVIGPTRMAYDRVIPLVDVTARLVGTALKSL